MSDMSYEETLTHVAIQVLDTEKEWAMRIVGNEILQFVISIQQWPDGNYDMMVAHFYKREGQWHRYKVRRQIYTVEEVRRQIENKWTPDPFGMNV